MSADWPQVPLGEVLNLQRRWVKVEPTKTYIEIGVRCFGNGIFHKTPITGQLLGDKRVLEIHPGDLVLNNVFAWEGAVAVAGPEDAGKIGSHRFVTCTPDSERCTTPFFRWFFASEAGLTLLQKASPGSAGRNRTLNLDQFLASPVSLPSLTVQRRIVARVEAVAARVSEALRLREEAHEAAGALIGGYLRRILGSEHPTTWGRVRLGEVVIDCTYGTSEKTTDDSSGIPVLRMGNIQEGRLRLTDLKYLPLSAVTKLGLSLEHGDILVNRTNSAELVGKCAVFESTERFSFASYLIRVRVNTEKAAPRFIASFINSPLGREYMFAERRQMTGQANVNSKKLLALYIPLPPLTEQRRIIAHLDMIQAKADALRALQTETAAELDALLPAVLAKAFAGEL